jgi:hypothetical protein
MEAEVSINWRFLMLIHVSELNLLFKHFPNGLKDETDVV